MNFGVIIQSNDAERVWNALRFAVASLRAGYAVQAVLLGEGVEMENIADTPHFDITAKLEEFKNLGGDIFACGTCLKIRSKLESKVCPLTAMNDIVAMVERSDKVLVFG